MDLCIPKVKLRVCQFPLWFMPQLRHLIKCLRTLQCKYTKHSTLNNFQKLVKTHAIQSIFFSAFTGSNSQEPNPL